MRSVAYEAHIDWGNEHTWVMDNNISLKLKAALKTENVWNTN